MTHEYDNRATARPTPQEITLMAAHASRAAEYRVQLDLMVVRSLARNRRKAEPTNQRKGRA